MFKEPTNEFGIDDNANFRLHQSNNVLIDFGEGFGAKSTSLFDNKAFLRKAGLLIPRTARIGISYTESILTKLREVADLFDESGYLNLND
jgi:hypothetical protein